jgi:coenzyme F420-0:L-glutamate ligase/coenzyme F420-1:gamma-L-glutamate ligase
MKNKIELIGLEGFPLVKAGDKISFLILESLQKMKYNLKDGDILLIAQSIISKSENLIKDLKKVKPSEYALHIYQNVKKKAEKMGLPIKSPQLIEIILQESKQILKQEHVIITETKQGFICANAGIDASNVEGGEIVTLLPRNSDKIAATIQKEIYGETNKQVTIIITDSFGRPFRVGSTGVAIGTSGINPLRDERGKYDLYGKSLKSTVIGQIDNLASASQLVMGEADQGHPVVLIRGYEYEYAPTASINEILREKKSDLFRPERTEQVIKNILKERRSYKISFSKRQVDKSLILECIEIAGWAPSAHNGQYWRYTILEKKKGLRTILINRMNKKLREDLKKSGKSDDYISKKILKTRHNFLNAPYLVLLSLDTQELENYADERRNKNEYLLGVQSISASATYLLIALKSRGLVSCWYCAPLFAKSTVKETLKLPETFDPMAFITVGYPQKNMEPPFRKDLNEIIFEVKDDEGRI